MLRSNAGIIIVFVVFDCIEIMTSVNLIFSYVTGDKASWDSVRIA